MGKVFSWDDIKEGHVPHLVNFVEAQKRIRERLEKEPAVIAGTLCGSVVNGTYSERSDIDCVVVYGPADRYEIAGLLAYLIRDIHTSLQIPVEFIPVDISIASTGVHHISPSFRVHIGRSSAGGGLIKDNPALYIHPPIFSAWTVTMQYLGHKMRRFEKGLCRPLDMHADPEKFLRKILEFPVHAARMMLSCVDLPNAGDRSSTVTELYAMHFPDEATCLLRFLLQDDQTYTEVVRAQLEKPDEREYRHALKEIYNRGWQAHEFARLNLLHLAKYPPSQIDPASL